MGLEDLEDGKLNKKTQNFQHSKIYINLRRYTFIFLLTFTAFSVGVTLSLPVTKYAMDRIMDCRDPKYEALDDRIRSIELDNEHLKKEIRLLKKNYRDIEKSKFPSLKDSMMENNSPMKNDHPQWRGLPIKYQ